MSWEILRTLNILPFSEEASSLLTARPVVRPGSFLREVLAQNQSPQLEGFPPFCGGLVGYFSYDYLKYAEPILRHAHAERNDFLDMDLMPFDKLVVFDSYRQKVILIAGVHSGDVDANYAKAAQTLEQMEQIIRTGPRKHFEALALADELTPRFSRERFCDMVRAAQHHIREGDIFQVVFYQLFAST